MDKPDSKNQPIKITFLEVNPPINEIVKNKEEITIIFQGHDNFYDFKKYLSSKVPINLNRYKKSLIMTLIKSNNIFATGLFTIRPGEQNIIFNYENKKKIVSTKAVNINNFECIKIKILCQFDNKEEEIHTYESNSHLNESKNNDSGNKYVPKVNLMKTSHLKNKNTYKGKKINEKKKKLLGNYIGNNTFKKNSINNSQEFSVGGEYNSRLTEEMNNNLKQNNNNSNINEFKKLNPYCSSKIYNNLTHKTEIEMSGKGRGQINKAKSKNYFSTIKKQYKNFGSQIKMNNSSLNLMNQKNNMNSIDNNENLNININNNPISNRILKPTISFNSKRNLKNNNKRQNFNSNKSLMNSIDNIISGQIIEHVDKSKKDNNKNNMNSEKKTFVNFNNNININNIGNNITTNNENKKRKFNNNNITINSISTAGTKKNDLEFSTNSLFDYKELEDKYNINKSNFMPFTNRANNETLQHKLSGNINFNKNINKHKFNKSLCQNSFVDKFFNENYLNINIKEKEKNSVYNLCKSCDKLKKEINRLNDLNLYKNNYYNTEINNNKESNDINNINSDIIKKDSIDSNVEDEEDLEFDNNYTRLKEDFNLLYNDDYISQINEDLLKLEIELFFEKMSELFSAYHLLMDEKILENQIIKRDYKENIAKYLEYMKLNRKLEYIKAQTKAKKYNLKEKGINLVKQNYKNTNINIAELNILKFIFPDKDKSKKLKKIISIIMKKKGNKELLGEKFKFLLK